MTLTIEDLKGSTKRRNRERLMRVLFRAAAITSILISLLILVVLARGGKKGAYEVKKGRKKEQTTLDLERVAGGPVDMSKFVCFLPGPLRPCHAHRAFSCRTWSTCSCTC